MSEQPEQILRGLFDAAVAAADPMKCVPAALPERPGGRFVVIGAGKASARMAEAVESVWGPCEGLVITRDGYARPTRGIEIVEASHPVPDQRGLTATGRLLDLLRACDEDTFVLALISGGGSALLVQPAGDISLEDKRQLNEALLASGAPINAVNTVRKHVSRVKGGQLAGAAYPARMLTLMISDVPGDDPAFIASGPTVGDPTSVADVLAVLERYRVAVPDSVSAALSETSGVLAPSSPELGRVENRIIAAPSRSLAAAADIARQKGIFVRRLGDDLEGEARDLARQHAILARQLAEKLTPGSPPVLLLSGGECTVTRRGSGVGGPNAEYALSLAVELDGTCGIWAIACDTDGVDGAADVAGAVVSPNTLQRARDRGLDPAHMLEVNDSHTFFEAIGDQVVPGPTLTNVNDFRAILIDPNR